MHLRCLGKLSCVFLVLAAGCSQVSPRTDVLEGRRRIKAFCIDFNWDPTGSGFAVAGKYAQADPAEHVRWYKELGANVIQTFAVNCCGHAWYPSAVAPVQPGLRSNFLGDVARLGHQEGMVVIGYFCVGANTWWGQTHPELSHGTPSILHIPLTSAYLDYLCASIQDALKQTEIDGIILDWFYNASLPDKHETTPWLDCEKQMYAELLGEPFPGEDNITAARRNEFHRRAVDRAWGRVRAAAKSARPDCIIWLTALKINTPEVANSRMLREVDWLMNESPDPEQLAAARIMKGAHTRLIQCICGWGDQHDPMKFVDDPQSADIGLYGFTAADLQTTLPGENPDSDWLKANATNVELMRRVYQENGQ